jgi:hypothetical protein
VQLQLSSSFSLEQNPVVVPAGQHITALPQRRKVKVATEPG